MALVVGEKCTMLRNVGVTMVQLSCPVVAPTCEAGHVDDLSRKCGPRSLRREGLQMHFGNLGGNGFCFDEVQAEPIAERGASLLRGCGGAGGLRVLYRCSMRNDVEGVCSAAVR